jgi:hypothetical protein
MIRSGLFKYGTEVKISETFKIGLPAPQVPQDGDTGVKLIYQIQHDLVEVRSEIQTLPSAAV